MNALARGLSAPDLLIEARHQGLKNRRDGVSGSGKRINHVERPSTPRAT